MSAFDVMESARLRVPGDYLGLHWACWSCGRDVPAMQAWRVTISWADQRGCRVVCPPCASRTRLPAGR